MTTLLGTHGLCMDIPEVSYQSHDVSCRSCDLASFCMSEKELCRPKVSYTV